MGFKLLAFYYRFQVPEQPMNSKRALFPVRRFRKSTQTWKPASKIHRAQQGDRQVQARSRGSLNHWNRVWGIFYYKYSREPSKIVLEIIFPLCVVRTPSPRAFNTASKIQALLSLTPCSILQRFTLRAQVQHNMSEDHAHTLSQQGAIGFKVHPKYHNVPEHKKCE